MKLFAPDAQDLERISVEMKTTKTYFFTREAQNESIRATRDSAAFEHEVRMCQQAQVLADHVIDLQRPLAIDDIYAHPLISRQDVVFGHCIRAFAGVPVFDDFGRMLGVLCTVHDKKRNWRGDDVAMLQRATEPLPTVLEYVGCAC